MLGLSPFALAAQPQPGQPQIKVTPSAPPSAAPGRPGAMMVPPTSTEMPEKTKLSYAIGMYFGRDITNRLTHGQIVIDTNLMIQALTAVVDGKPTTMSEKEVQDVFNQLRNAMRAKQQVEQQAAALKNEQFLQQFAKSPGVKVTPSGLEYKILHEGAGPVAKGNDKVTVAYRGTLTDGTEFDRNDSFTTAVHGGIIRGWQEMLGLMNVGEKVQVVIPPKLGYDQRSMGKIPANSVLVFDMEMKALQPEQSTPASTSRPPTSFNPPPSSSTPVVSGEIIKVPSADELKKGAKIEVIKAGDTNAAAQSK